MSPARVRRRPHSPPRPHGPTPGARLQSLTPARGDAGVPATSTARWCQIRPRWQSDRGPTGGRARTGPCEGVQDGPPSPVKTQAGSSGSSLPPPLTCSDATLRGASAYAKKTVRPPAPAASPRGDVPRVFLGGLYFAAQRLKPLQASGTRGAGLWGGASGARGPEHGTLAQVTALGCGTLGQAIGSKCVPQARCAIHPVPPEADAAGRRFSRDLGKPGRRTPGTDTVVCTAPPGTPTAEVGGRSRRAPRRLCSLLDSLITVMLPEAVPANTDWAAILRPPADCSQPGGVCRGVCWPPLATAGHPGLSSQTSRVRRVPCPLLQAERSGAPGGGTPDGPPSLTNLSILHSFLSQWKSR